MLTEQKANERDSTDIMEKKEFQGKQGHGDSNPGLMAENHLSWASRRWPRTQRKYQKGPFLSMV